MPYSQGAYSTPGPDPSPVTRVFSSRKVNFVTRRYENDADGNDLSQPSIQQVVTLIMAFEVEDQFTITPQAQEAARQDILNELAPLTAAPNPEIDNVEIIFDETGGDSTQKLTIKFRDITTDTNQSVEFN